MIVLTFPAETMYVKKATGLELTAVKRFHNLKCCVFSKD